MRIYTRALCHPCSIDDGYETLFNLFPLLCGLGDATLGSSPHIRILTTFAFVCVNVLTPCVVFMCFLAEYARSYIDNVVGNRNRRRCSSLLDLVYLVHILPRMLPVLARHFGSALGKDFSDHVKVHCLCNAYARTQPVCACFACRCRCTTSSFPSARRT